jgi:hypothetical protein
MDNITHSFYVNNNNNGNLFRKRLLERGNWVEKVNEKD